VSGGKWGVGAGLFVASSVPSYPSIALLVGVVLVVTCGDLWFA
jgi:hypothetical protein